MPLQKTKKKEFDASKEDWHDYIEQVEQYFTAHGLESENTELTGTKTRQ